MPRPSKGARLWLRPPGRDESGAVTEPAVWIIKDGKNQRRTGCGQSDRPKAEAKLAAYISEKYQPSRREKPLSEVLVADVINIYLADVVPGQARPAKAVERAERLLDFFGRYSLDDINGSLCREYAAWRKGKGRSNKGRGGGAKRDLEDLRAAINHHQAEGLHRSVVRVVLPERGKARQRWLTRSEAAKLLWTCWKTREIQRGAPTDKFPLRHLCRFLLLGLYTGSRPGAVMNASWERGEGRSFVDVEKGLFYRLAEGAVETDKRQPPVKIEPGLLSFLRRWRKLDGGQGNVVTFGGQPVKSVKTAMNSAVAKAKLETGVSAYTLRHTLATWLVAKGVPTITVADFIGTSEAMILRHYRHLMPGYQDAAVAAIRRK